MPEIIEIKAIGDADKCEKIKVCAYARVSSDSEDQMNSFIAQVDYYTEHIRSNSDWEYVDIYADEAITGTKIDKRDEFLRMLSDCRKGKIDKILTKSISRFSRNTRDCIQTVRELQALGIEVIFEKENIKTMSMSSETTLGILSSMAQEESVSISNNMRMSYQRRMKSGAYNTCCAPFGFDLQGSQIIVNKVESKVVKRIFTDYINGKSLICIAKDLTNEGVSNKTGIPTWSWKTIEYMLKNERYMGDAILQKEYTTDTLPFKRIHNKGEIQQYYVQNANEPIILREEFEKARQLIQTKANMFAKSRETQSYPLSKMIYCKDCGIAFKRKKGKNYKILWVCRKRDSGKENCCTPQISENKIYDAFVRMYNKLKVNEKYILSPIVEQLQKIRDAYYKNNTRIGVINKEISELTEQNLVVNRLKVKGYIEPVIFIEQCNEINSKIQKLRLQKKQLQSKDDVDDLIDNTKRLIQILQNNTLHSFDERILKLIVKKIIAHKNKLIFVMINELELKEDWNEN